MANEANGKKKILLSVWVLCRMDVFREPGSRRGEESGIKNLRLPDSSILRLKNAIADKETLATARQNALIAYLPFAHLHT